MQEEFFEEPESAEERDHDPEKIRCALQVANRQWEAEQENARRLANRTNGVLATIAAASGLGLFKLSDLPVVEPAWVAVIMRTSLAVTALCMLAGLIHILDLRPPPRTKDERWWRWGRKLFRFIRTATRRPGEPPEEEKPKHPFASSALHTLAEPGASPPIQGPDLLALKIEAIREIEYYRTAGAAIDLHARNIERQDGLARGQSWLWRAALLAFVAALVCLVFSHGRGL